MAEFRARPCSGTAAGRNELCGVSPAVQRNPAGAEHGRGVDFAADHLDCGATAEHAP